MLSGIKVAPPERKEYLQISTLGHFQVKWGNVNYTEKSSRSHKTWELFKYLLTHKNKLLPAEVIAETLWPDQEYADTRASMRVQVHRIRQLFTENLFPHFPLEISYTQGCYTLKTQDCWLDADEFSNLSRKAHDFVRHNGNHEEIIALYRRAISLYKGDYLAEISSGWVLPVRSYYRRLYLKNILALAGLLRDTGRYGELIDNLEKSFIIEPFEEELHTRYMEALLEKGKNTQALNHYEHITAVLYQEKGAKPSGGFRQIYRDIKRASEKVPLDFTDFQQMLSEQEEGKGALSCEMDFFQFLCKLQRRVAERSGSPAYVIVLTMATNELLLLPSTEIERLMDQLEQVLLHNLRRADVICRLGESQFILLVPEINLKQAQKVLQRIRKSYKETFPQKGTELRSTALSLLAKE